ncbi:protein BCCIP-like protein [Iris pallida]|uniref:Protein BCCIP-like protein n=1 Tax=Iris pallida TaxID=29817 RepID=A0AAX6FDM0_IRIPA|nr:protein BCCIP-like protein [Iris pallida]
MDDRRRPAKRRRRRPSKPHPHLLSFSSFSRHMAHVSNSRAPAHLTGTPSRSDISKPKPATKRIQTPCSSSTSEEEGEEDEEAPMEMVQADFGFFDPKPGDFGGVKLLLQNYLDDRAWDLSGFVDLILEQMTVGTVVKSDGYDDDDEEEKDEDEGVYAVVSALNFGRYAGHECFGELKKYLIESCSDDSTKTKLKLLLQEQASDVGLLVSQRFVNCPNQLVPPLYDALFDEVSWATEDEPTKELRDSFRFKFYLLITRIYENKNYNQRKARANSDGDEPIIYVKEEDEIFRELSSFSFTFPLHAEQLAPQELKNYRTMGLVMVVEADQAPKFRTKLKSLLADS